MKALLIIVTLSVTSLYGQQASKSDLSRSESDLIITADVPKGAIEHRQAVSITASNTISGSAVYRAESVVQLKDGFHAGAGTFFRAYIGKETPTEKETAQEQLVQKTLAPETAPQKEEAQPSIQPIRLGLNIYPNPTSDIFQVDLGGEQLDDFRMEIRSMNGQLLYEQVLNQEGTKTFSLDISSYPAGTYLVRLLELETEKVRVGKIVKLGS